MHLAITTMSFVACLRESTTYMIRRRYFRLIDGHNSSVNLGESSFPFPGLTSTNDRRPTPNPATILPTTMIVNPFVNVWIAPPTAKTTAPEKRVPLLPRISPMRPAASDVTMRCYVSCVPVLCVQTFLPNAPTSSTATMVPTSKADGLLKNLRK